MGSILVAISAFGFVISSIYAIRKKQCDWIFALMMILAGLFAAHMAYHFASITAWESLILK